MKKDVINGFEWLIFDESELEAARKAEHPRVLIATTCDDCGGSIQASVSAIDNRLFRPIMHRDGAHARGYNSNDSND